MRVVLLETSGNQRYIFATNKLRENVGASELTYLAGTRYVLDAVKDVAGLALWDASPRAIRNNLADPIRNPALERSGTSAEVVVATSGKAILLVTEEEVGRKIIRRVTRRALKEAPGLDIRGVIGHEFSFGSGSIHEEVRKVHELLEELRSKEPGPETRFARLPVIVECASSGLPANISDGTHPEEAERGPRSLVSFRKQGMARPGLERMQEVVGGRPLQLCTNIDAIEREVKQLDWLAVIHADGNGIGRIFLDFERITRTENNARAYIDQLRRFSLALEECTERAFREALLKLHERLSQRRRNAPPEESFQALPVVPLVLGGDDLTVLCDGRHAMNLAHDFLVSFERETAHAGEPFSGIISRIAARASAGIGRLSGCAGIAIVKPHYPFHAAYDLAEELLQSAKHVKDVVRPSAPPHPQDVYPCSALDFHVHYDASGASLEKIRARLVVDHDRKTSDGKEDSTYLYSRPYVVTDPSDLEEAQPEGQAWCKHHDWKSLTDCVRAIRAEDKASRRRQLPSSMLHEIREGLFGGRDQANARLKLVIHRYPNAGFEKQLEPLFHHDGEHWRSGFFDALDLAKFLAADHEGPRP